MWLDIACKSQGIFSPFCGAALSIIPVGGADGKWKRCVTVLHEARSTLFRGVYMVPALVGSPSD